MANQHKFHTEPIFWKSGKLARNVKQIVTDLSKFNPGNGFWAIVTTFEGEFIAIEFEDVSDSEFPFEDWQPISQDWKSSISQRDYCEKVEQVKDEISKGEVYQVNLCRVLETNCSNSLAGLFSGIQSKNPAPQAAFLRVEVNGQLLEIASASPELFIARVGNKIKCSPIKGTNSKPVFGEKDKAENVMILDLMRNDFGRVCKAGTVEVTRLLAVEEHPGLFHLVSDVEGELKENISWREILKEILPAGSISGAPKSSAVKLISKIEPSARSFYCGIFGFIQGEVAQLGVSIRTFYKIGNKLSFGTGAGITWASVAESEWQETELKAKKLIAIASGKI